MEELIQQNTSELGDLVNYKGTIKVSRNCLADMVQFPSQLSDGEPKRRKSILDNWRTKIGYKLTGKLWTIERNRVTLKFEFEYRCMRGNWIRADGFEKWEYDQYGQVTSRYQVCMLWE